MRVRGVENMSNDQVNFEIQRGRRFVLYDYCVSLIIMTFPRTSDVYFLRAGESSFVKGLPWTALTLLLGWWGVPWGPIYSIQSLAITLGGGKDVTAKLTSATPAASTAAVPGT